MDSELRVAFLTNLIPPYHKPLYLLWTQHYRAFRLFISTAMEANRPWLPEWQGLDVIPQKGITLRRLWRHPSGFNEPVLIHFPLDTLELLSKFKPDVIVSVEMGFRTLVASLYAAFHPKVRLFIWSEVTATTEQGRGGMRQVLRRLLARRAHGYFALGPGGVRYIRSLGVPAERIFKISYSTDLAPFLALSLERHGPAAHRLLFSGQLVSRKGLPAFLRTLNQWAERNPARMVEFHLVGGGPEQENLADLPLSSNVKLVFIGPVQYHQLPAIYAEAGILVLPTFADTWAVVVNEALASGLPVLGSLNSQAVEVMVDDGVTGWTFHPEQPAEMLAALDRALSLSEDELNCMRAEARRSALRVTPERTADILQEALRASAPMN